MQQILATGAVGLVGSRFLEMYQDKYTVSNIDVLSGVDITDKSSVESFIAEHPSTFMIHLAAFTDTGRAFAETGDKAGLCYKVNVVGTQNIAEICKDRGIHLIHISTDFVFDGTKNTPYTEDDQVNPLEWYGETKSMAEQAVVDSGVSYTILRLSYPYRANFPGKPDLVSKIRTSLASGELPPQFSDTIITPTLVDDLARAFDAVIEHKPQGIFHTVGSTPLSPYELARKVALAYDFDPASVKEGSLTEYLKSSARPFARTVAMSNHKSTEVLGLHFATIDEGLSEIKKQQGL